MKRIMRQPLAWYIRTRLRTVFLRLRAGIARLLPVLVTVAGISLGALAGLAPGECRAQVAVEAEATPDLRPPIRTDSPRDTIETYLRITDEMETAIATYLQRPSYELVAEIALMSDQLNSLIDLSSVAAATRRERGIETFEYLMDIFGRIGKPDTAAFPDVDFVDESGTDSFRIPETPLRIVRMTEGEREGEFLFSNSTLKVAPRFYAAVRHLPLQSRLGIDSWSNFGPQLTGPLVPPAVVQSVPSSLKRLWLDTPAWKVIFLTSLLVIITIVVLLLGRLLAWITPSGRVSGLLLKTLPPIAVMYGTLSLLPAIAGQVNPSGQFAALFDTTMTLVTYAAAALLFWLAVRILVEWIIRSPKIPEQSLDADLLRLAAATFGLIGVMVIIAYGGQAIGLPIMSVIAGLGIGGLAVALAVRPTFENLIGGVILYVDRPVRVGDFCSVGNQTGTVEGIGIRSTKLRALDRTIISIPNAQFADMQIINWAQCDRMLISDTIGIRYDTTSDQLRYLLVLLRKMLHAHPRIDNETVRVRCSGFGESALNVDIRVYAETREWNDFFAIREDIYLRVLEIVEQAGTGFAFPSQTLYMARDGGRDMERSAKAEETVREWRRSKQLPFPSLSRSELERLDNSLDYPPHGSPDAEREDDPAGSTAEPLSKQAEPLSAAVEPDPEANGEPEERDRKA